MKQAFILLFSSILLLSNESIATAKATVKKQCGSWEFTKDGGFEGGELTAYVECKDKKNSWTPLSLACYRGKVMFRYEDSQNSFRWWGKEKREPATAQLSFFFPNAQFTFKVRYADAIPDWESASYNLPKYFIEALAHEKSVSIRLHPKGKKSGKKEPTPLKGARKAITRMLSSCNKR